MRLDEYTRQDALGLAELVHRGEATPAELLELSWAALERWNPRVNAVTQVFRVEAEQELARGLPAGPFTGVPFLLKDLGVGYAGKPTTMGSRLFSGFTPPVDSELMVRYRRAGLLTVGKTNLPELGLDFVTEPHWQGPTRNPWDPSLSPGGSSGGSAAAVAARIVPMAHGSDAAGSLRVPASCCGLFGLKPTRGRLPPGPAMGERIFGLGVEHALTRSVRDSAALLDATAGEDPGAPYSAPPPARSYLEEVTASPGRLRMAVIDAAWDGARVCADSERAVNQAAELCAALGHDVVRQPLPINAELVRVAATSLLAAFAGHLLNVVGPRLGALPAPGLVEPRTLAIAALGGAMSAHDLVSALAQRDLLARQVGGWFREFDVVLTAVQAVLPPPIGSPRTEDGSLNACFDFAPFTALFNLTGNPAMSVPLHVTATGLPVGVQFVARTGDESSLFRLAGQLERAAPWADRQPLPS